MIRFLTRLFAPGELTLSEATPRDAAAFAPLHAAAFRRGWSEDDNRGRTGKQSKADPHWRLLSRLSRTA